MHIFFKIVIIGQGRKLHISIVAHQGVCTGMTCFKMIIDDLRLRHPICKYVDDPTLSEIIQKVCNESTIQQSVDDTVKWTKQNDMMINASQNA